MEKNFSEAKTARILIAQEKAFILQEKKMSKKTLKYSCVLPFLLRHLKE